MKKLFLLLVAATLCATATFAQSSMLATLSHEGQISTYYGATALRDAYNAADNGDVITLSSGTFNAVNFEKAVTVRGAGMRPDTISNSLPTIITGDFSINIPDSVEQKLIIEGIFHHFVITIYGTLQNSSFLKSRFRTITANSNEARMKNLSFIHCYITGRFILPSESSATFVNCYVKDAYSRSTSSSNIEFTNCMVISTGESGIRFDGIYRYPRLINIESSTFNNCIIYGNHGNGDDVINSNSIAFNCIGCGLGNNNIFQNVYNSTNTTITDGWDSIFKTFRGVFNDDQETLELTDEAKDKYLGMDGTQVGIYGGNLPFSSTPTNPQITKCNVAAKSTADGKLSVDITVNGAE
ncbi:MAG: hypothetical protein IJV34_02320 [Prevotella sp.]|nr:hypothetical protein [Prevotella sp.]